MTGLDAAMWLDALLAHRLIVVTGKGGVGKSVVSAMFARAAARRGRRVVLLEADPREAQFAFAGVPPSGGEFVPAGPNLQIQNVQPRRVFEDAVREHVSVEMLANRVVRSAVFEHFVDAAPGLKELAVLGHAMRIVRGIEKTTSGPVDLVVLDAPATGHSIAMLSAPRVVTGVVDAGPFRELAGELAAFIADPATTAVAVVTLAEEMPVQETLELHAAMREQVQREPEVLVVNGVYPPAGDAEPVDGEAEAIGLWRRRRAINDRELARLEADWTGARVVLPLIAHDRGPMLVDALVASLLRQTDAAPA